MSIREAKRTRLHQLIVELRQQLDRLEAELEESELEPEHKPATTFSVLELSDHQGQIFSQVSRLNRATTGQVAHALAISETQVRPVLRELTERGLLVEDRKGDTFYYELPQFQRKARELPKDMWDLLESRLS
jgi:predicted HTH transcriptional regulator